MKLICLSGCPNKPCYILKFKGLTLMLDCGLDMGSALNFMPVPLVHSQKLQQLGNYHPKDGQDPAIEMELKEANVLNHVFVDSVPEFAAPDLTMVDMAEVDCILISNYSNMLALPYITEETGFKGMIFLTEPTLHFGRLFMEETIEYIARSTKGQSARRWKDLHQTLPHPLCESVNPQAWRTIYNREMMESCLSKVQLVGYSEKMDVFGLLEVSPVSSGYRLGSSNWIISSEFERIAYVSGTSTLTTHPCPMEQAPLRNMNCVILTALTQTPQTNPDPMIGEFCKTVIETTRQGGNVLVPCYPSGIVYDLFECLAGQMDINSLSTIPMFFVSPVADSSLAYSNIMAEWLSATKQNRVYLPDEPFPHGNLAKSGRLKSFRSLHDENFSTEYRQPCIMFCGHPSLRFGDAIHFIELWGSNPNNTIVFTEPSFNHALALAPFQPLLMKAVHCPIDTSLNFGQSKKLIRDLKPGCLVVPEIYTHPPAATPNRSDLKMETDIPKYTLSRYETITLPIKTKFESINIDPKLASALRPVEIRPGLAIATITGNLIAKNNKFELLAIEDKPIEIPQKRKRDSRGLIASSLSTSSTPLIPIKSRKPAEYLYGKLNVKEFVQKLSAIGIQDARVEELSKGCSIINLESEDTLIQVEESQTHILSHDETAKDKDLNRQRIRDLLLGCLNKF
ncbi:hypothetical protein TCAL_03963 [Tigriopus californicus]|uniref:Beta-Casp domain-containing protein n=1 Tax=Tigriopus californicus TaxID=6832 RepID=A0A553P450_TIGCA|nr:integrator complex subunit 9-like [Tigriopus californicus]TRY72412.1 hypothetical protein TCAL_03963 [Tigriopus californicus]|eukprot:TCALIF_03963-PA protein Name:"Similar to Ints9 Integrator complex subunit 9 (Mus musculus)" AED:0.09 eAED:0.09 QI:165/1/1/1/0.77/0.8/10/26/679